MTNVGSVELRRSAISCDLCVTILLMVALVVPLVVVSGTFFPYVVPRNLLFRVVVETAAAIRILEIFLAGKRLDLRREYVLFALASFLLAITVSALFSPAPAHSFFGDFERMGGVWAWLHLVGFFLLLRTISERHFSWLLYVALAAGVAASVHAIAESRSGSLDITITGNRGLLAGYLLVSLAIPVHLAYRARKYKPLYLVAAAIELYAILITQNRSSALGLIVGGAAAAFLLGLNVRRRRGRLIPLAITGVAAAVLIWVLTPRIGITDFNGVDAPRLMQWKAGLAGFRDRPLLGFGIDNYQLVWSAHFDPRIEQLGMDVFDRAHNQYIEILATTGIIGALAFLALWAAIAYSLYRAFAASRLTAPELAIFTGANIAFAAYLVFWFVDINAAIIWMLLSALISARCNPFPVFRDSVGRASLPVAFGVVIATVSVLAFVLYRHAYVPMRASVALATLDAHRGNPAQFTTAIETIASSSARQTSHFAPILSGFVRNSLAKSNSFRADTFRDETLERAFQAAITEFDSELRRDPLNDRLHTAAAQLLIEAAKYYRLPAYRERAIALLERAIELNPGRSQQQRVLASVRSDSSVLRARSGN